jgi:long-chain acyl-CoA synthetase
MTLREKTAPGVLAERARTTPDAVAFRSKHLGLYRSRTWREYAALVARCARGLQALGLAAGERVAIMGDACEEWLVADLGAQAAGAITYGIYPTSSASELEYQLRDGGAVLFVAENQEYVDKVLPLLGRLPALRTVLVIDDSAMFAYQDKRITRWRDLMVSAPEGSLEALAAKLDPSAPAFIVYTSGTTGAPKGALVSHGAHLAAAANLLEHYPTLAEKDHRTVVYLPLCHVLGRDVAITLPLLGRVVPHFGDDIEDLATTFFEVAPSALFTVPRYLQKFAAQVMIGMNASTASKRWAYDLAMRAGRREAQRLWAGQSKRSLAYRLARAAVLEPLLGKLGMDQLELVICGGAPLPRETMALWHIWGVNVVEIYGQTEEAGAIISGQKGPFPRPGSVGTLASGWQMRLAPDGEIQVNGAHVFERYWNNDEATAAVKGADGWLRTGDVGELEAGVLRLVDRTRDFIVTAGGKTLSPSHIENALRASPYIAEAVVVGHARKYISALIEIDFDTVADWARSQNVAYTGFTGLATSAPVEKLIAGEVARANGELARVEQVKAFRILPKALDPQTEGEPVTPTRKVKRSLMLERFRDLVESMYDDREERLVQSGVGGALNPAS